MPEEPDRGGAKTEDKMEFLLRRDAETIAPKGMA